MLDLVLRWTGYRIRVLTKNCVVGKPEWIEYFLRNKDRFVVGLSTGTLDDEWARKVEIGTSLPSARLRALRALQDAGVPTFGMACPIFPDAVSAGGLDALIDQIRPDRVETLWAEPYNDRANWRAVRDGYAPASPGYQWFTRAFEHRDGAAWSRYATEIFIGLKRRAEAEGWLPKLKYLLYEDGIVAADASNFSSPDGLLFQSPTDDHGFSRNPHIRALQLRT